MELSKRRSILRTLCIGSMIGLTPLTHNKTLEFDVFYSLEDRHI